MDYDPVHRHIAYPGLVDTRLLNTFTTLARTGSFTAAAAELHLAQSTVTVHIRSLEREFGTRLFDRLPTGALLKGAPVSVSPGPSLLGGARGQSCAAALGANQVLSAGGRTYNTAVSKAKSSAVVEVMTLLNSGNITPANADPLPVARYDHTCTTLADGSVLVLGGINVDEEAGTQEILNDAYIFTPKPVD